MSRLRTILLNSWAFLALPIIIATFVANDFWARQLVANTGLKVSPWDTGGEVVQTINHGEYRTQIHQTVFEGVIWERRKGFVQINWLPVRKLLPEIIDEEIDYDRDGVVDFGIQFNTKTDQAKLNVQKPYVLGVTGIFKLEDERAVRISLKNRKMQKPL